jgi:hypothetical protein
MHDKLSAEEQPETDRRHRNTRDRGPDRRAARSKRRNRSRASNEHDVQREIQHSHCDAEAQRRPRVARGAQRTAKHEEHQQPDVEQEHRLEEWQRFGPHFWCRIDHIQQRRGERVTERRQDADGEDERRQKRLIDRTVHLVVVVCTRRARHEHAHSREQ